MRRELELFTRRLLLAGAACLVLLSAAAAAQETFRLRRASPKYDVTVTVAACGGPEQDGNENTCGGAGTVALTRKGARAPFQTLRLENVEIYKDTVAYNSRGGKHRGLYSEEYGVVFEDFDFDGEQDLAVCNGRNSGYSGPSYDIFLYDRASGRFVRSRRLTELNEGAYLGLFHRDTRRRLLVTYSKSGCCYHETEKFRVVGGRPVLVEKISEDATVTDDAGRSFVVTTTRRRVGRRWVETVRRERIKEENR